MIILPEHFNSLAEIAGFHAQNFDLNTQVLSDDWAISMLGTEWINTRPHKERTAKAITAAKWLALLPCFSTSPFRLPTSRTKQIQLPIRKWDGAYRHLPDSLRVQCDECPINAMCEILHKGSDTIKPDIGSIPEAFLTEPPSIELIEDPYFIVNYDESSSVPRLTYPSNTFGILPPIEVISSEAFQTLTEDLALQIYNLLWLSDISEEDALQLMGIGHSRIIETLQAGNHNLKDIERILESHPFNKESSNPQFTYCANGKQFQCERIDGKYVIRRDNSTEQISKAAYTYLKHFSSGKYFPNPEEIFAICIPFNVRTSKEEVEEFCGKLLNEIQAAENLL